MSIILGLLLIFSLIIIIISLKLPTMERSGDDEYDLIIQLSNDNTRPTETVACLRAMFEKEAMIVGLNDICQDFVELNGKKYFVSLFNQTSEKLNRHTEKIHNDVAGLVGGFIEHAYQDSMTLVNRSSYEFQSTENYITANDEGNQIILSNVIDKFSGKMLAIYNCRITTSDYGDPHGYRVLTYFLRVIFENFKKHKVPFIVLGNFNLHDWQIIVEREFGKSMVWSSGQHNICTINDSDGLANIDAIIIHRSIAKRVEFGTRQLTPLKSRRHYVLYAKLFRDGVGKTSTIDAATAQYNEYLKRIDTELNYLNRKSTTHIDAIESIDDITLAERAIPFQAPVYNSLEALLNLIIGQI